MQICATRCHQSSKSQFPVIIGDSLIHQHSPKSNQVTCIANSMDCGPNGGFLSTSTAHKNQTNKLPLSDPILWQVEKKKKKARKSFSHLFGHDSSASLNWHHLLDQYGEIYSLSLSRKRSTVPQTGFANTDASATIPKKKKNMQLLPRVCGAISIPNSLASCILKWFYQSCWKGLQAKLSLKQGHPVRDI